MRTSGTAHLPLLATEEEITLLRALLQEIVWGDSIRAVVAALLFLFSLFVGRLWSQEAGDPRAAPLRRHFG